MAYLSNVSETALITLKSRVIESEKINHVIRDDVGSECLEKILSLLPDKISPKILYRKLSSTLTLHIALRSRKYDSYTKEFLEKNPDGLVVNLGCGFDTRYWRVSDNSWKYIEIDLPQVIEVKNKILKHKVN